MQHRVFNCVQCALPYEPSILQEIHCLRKSLCVARDRCICSVIRSSHAPLLETVSVRARESNPREKERMSSSKHVYVLCTWPARTVCACTAYAYTACACVYACACACTA
jgi:hypothetical protein